MKPLSKRVIIKPEEVAQESKSGIVLGFQKGQSELLRQIFPDKAEVIVIGEGVSAVAIGDRVVFQRWGAREVGEGQCVVAESDIIAIIGGN